MIAHKTSGDWADVTSMGRNEIVFEGRNKEYGAYEVRQRYKGTLLLALLIAGSFGVVCTAVPFVLHFFNKSNLSVASTTTVVVHPRTIVEHFDHHTIIPPAVTHPHPPAPTQRHTPPRITATAIHMDSIATSHQISATTIGVTTTTGTTNNPVSLNPVGTGTGTGPVIEEKAKPEPPLLIVEHMPTFKGDLDSYIKNNLVYPESESGRGIQGTIYVSFVVEKDGSITNVTLKRGISGGAECSDEALKIIANMPTWNPGEQNGHPVRVLLNLPIKFTIKD